MNFAITYDFPYLSKMIKQANHIQLSQFSTKGTDALVREFIIDEKLVLTKVFSKNISQRYVIKLEGIVIDLSLPEQISLFANVNLLWSRRTKNWKGWE